MPSLMGRISRRRPVFRRSKSVANASLTGERGRRPCEVGGLDAARSAVAVTREGTRPIKCFQAG